MTSRSSSSLFPSPGPSSPQSSSIICSQQQQLKNSSPSNHSFHSIVPEISVDIPDLESFQNDLQDHPLSLTVKPDDGSSLSTLNAVKSPLLEIQNLDFLGPAEVIKKFFKLSHTEDQPFFALHRMGNTLLVDSLVGIEEHEKKSASQEISPDVAVFSPDRPMNSIIENMSATTAVSNFMCGLPEPPALIVEDTVMQGGSPYLPPPGYFFPQHPPVLPFRNTFRWQLHDLEFAVGSDLLVYNTPDRPALTVAPIDMTKEIPLTTCLDHYLDNVMANVPELALCLHAKGFLRGISVCGTEDIPDMRDILQSDCLNDKIESFSTKKINRVKQKNKRKAPIFDPQVIELNALTILRFLKQNCSKENSTYIVHFTRKESEVIQEKENSSPDAIQIYDLQALSLSGQKKWKWLLAMLSHRFATRLGHHYSIASPQSRVILRDRQLSLYQSCYDLLLQIRQLGGGNHGTICAAVLEHIADIHKSRAETSHQNKYQGGNTTGSSTKSTKKKPSKKKSHDKNVEFIPSCDLECSHNSCGTFQTEFHDDELDNIDYAFEIDKSLELFLRALSDLGEVITSQLSTADANGSENSPPESMNSIMIGDIACEASEPLENFEIRESRISATSVNLVLVIQYSGLFHKALSSCISVIKNTLSSSITRLGDSRLVSAMQYLNRIVPFCKQWLSVTAKIKEDLVAYREQTSPSNGFDKSSLDSSMKTQSLSLEEALLLSETNPAEVLEESIQDMWSIDRTVLDDLPVFWDLLGEICREIFSMKPNKGDTQDLENLAGQLKDWKDSILSLQEIIVCFLQMSAQASCSIDCGFNFLDDLQVLLPPADVTTESKMASLWTLLTGREWTLDDSAPFIKTSKNVFKMLVPLFQDKILSNKVTLSPQLIDSNLIHTSVHLLKVTPPPPPPRLNSLPSYYRYKLIPSCLGPCCS
jgi:hypothetical protein